MSADNPLGVTWSLAIEEQFYLLFPLLLTLALKSGLRRKTIITILIMLSAAITLNRAFLSESGAVTGRLYYASDTRADGLLIGCLVAVLLAWNLLPLKRFETSFKALAVLSLAFLSFMVATGSASEAILYQGGLLLVELAIASLLIAVVAYKSTVLVTILRQAPLVWIGRVSYGLYLWHWPVRYFVYGKSLLPPTYLHLATAVVLSLLFTICSFYCLERPFLRLKTRFSKKSSAINQLELAA
jgi:peptidoglycan/LPS O-acetylase OafA/YrhL